MSDPLLYPDFEKFIAEISRWPILAMDASEDAMEQAVDFLHGKIPDYPPTLPSQIYHRTQVLRNHWTESVDRQPWEVIGEVGTNVPYAPWVVGPSFPGREFDGKVAYQARIHVDRWWQFETIMDDNVDGAWQVFNDTFWPEFLKKIDLQGG